MVLRDKCWLWGHPAGRYNEDYNLDSRMTPMECCNYLGIRNVFMVPVNWEVNERQYNKSFTTLNQVGWGYDYCDFDKIIEQAKEFPNIGCVAFDDFTSNLSSTHQNNHEGLKALFDKYHNNNVRRLDTWMVIYTMHFGVTDEYDAKLQPFLDMIDGAIMWTWSEKDVCLIPEKFEKFKSMTPNTRRMVGVYLFNFGDGKEATGEAVKWQLDWAREKLLAGEIEGIVLHTNTMADLDFEAYDVALEWMKTYGDEVID